MAYTQNTNKAANNNYQSKRITKNNNNNNNNKKNNNDTRRKPNKGKDGAPNAGGKPQGNQNKYCNSCKKNNHNTNECKYLLQNPDNLTGNNRNTYCIYCNNHTHNTDKCTNHMARLNYEAKHKGAPRAQNLGSNPFVKEVVCDICQHTGHKQEACPIRSNRDEIYNPRRAQFEKDVNEMDDPSYHAGFTDMTQVVQVPSDRVTSLMPHMFNPETVPLGNRVLTRETVKMMGERHVSGNRNYWSVPWTLQCLLNNFDLSCGFKGCSASCKLVDARLDVVMVNSCTFENIDMGDSRQPIYIETTCNHGNWARCFTWSRERLWQNRIQEVVEYLVKHSVDPIAEVGKTLRLQALAKWYEPSLDTVMKS